MRKGAFILGLLALFSPAALRAEGVAIDHRGVGCVEPARGGRGASSSGRYRASAPRALRVVAGDVVQLAAESLTFRLQGRPGERVVFTFRAERP